MQSLTGLLLPADADTGHAGRGNEPGG